MVFDAATLLTLLAVQGAAAAGVEPALPIRGEAAEIFLREAEVVALEEVDTKGITNPRKATLTDGELTLDAVFKDVDKFYLEVKLAGGQTLFRLKDNYKYEIAAYELDTLLGLGMVPPTVERRIGREWGSLQMWITGAMTEWQRTKIEQLSPPDLEKWNDQMSTLKVFLQLIWDTDYNNISNIMVDASWKIWKIDSSRAFYVDNELRRPAALTRFPRRLLALLERLDRTELEMTLKPWLDKRQIRALWERRCRILELAEKRVAELGETEALYD